MVDFRLTSGCVRVEFEVNSGIEFEAEFNETKSSIDEWISFEKAKSDGENSDPLTIKLLTGIYKKLDELSSLLKNEKNPRKELEFTQITDAIGFEGFSFGVDCLKEGEIYFARISLPLFVKSEIPVFFEAVNSRAAKITKITPSDEKEWAHFVARNEIMEIRKAKMND